MKGRSGFNDYRESLFGFVFETYKGCLGDGFGLARLKWSFFWEYLVVCVVRIINTSGIVGF